VFPYSGAHIALLAIVLAGRNGSLSGVVRLIQPGERARFRHLKNLDDEASLAQRTTAFTAVGPGRAIVWLPET